MLSVSNHNNTHQSKVTEKPPSALPFCIEELKNRKRWHSSLEEKKTMRTHIGKHTWHLRQRPETATSQTQWKSHGAEQSPASSGWAAVGWHNLLGLGTGGSWTGTCSNGLQTNPVLWLTAWKDPPTFGSCWLSSFPKRTTVIRETTVEQKNWHKRLQGNFLTSGHSLAGSWQDRSPNTDCHCGMNGKAESPLRNTLQTHLEL